MSVKLIVSGAAGRMGKRIIALAIESGQFDIIGAVEKAGHPEIGLDAGAASGSKTIDVKISDIWPTGANVVIDFTTPDSLDIVVSYCITNKAALVMGTTGLNSEQKSKVNAAAENIPVIYGTNMSIGMNVLFALVGQAAKMLGQEYDIEIVEHHHRFKKDAPSGSALTLAENIASATDRDFPACIVNGREGKEALREKGEIGMHAVRAGDITGFHSVMYSTLGETVTLEHRAHNRDNFARGALLAAAWLADKKPGTYSMPQVLGLK